MSSVIKIPAASGSSNVSLANEAITIGATTTAPTKGVPSEDKVYYYVKDGVLFAHYQYIQTDNTGSAAGSGQYLYSLPNSYQAHGDWVGANSNYATTLGTGLISNHSLAQGATSSVVRATLYSSTQLRLIYFNTATSTQPQSNTIFPMNTTNLYISFSIQVPIVV